MTNRRSYRLVYFFICWFLLIVLLTACRETPGCKPNSGLMLPGFDLPFDLNCPSHRINLSNALVEISGLTWGGGESLYAINDERGILFQISSTSGAILDEISFGKKDDYEAVARMDTLVFIAESNGNIKVVNLNLMKKTNEYENFLSNRNDVEGATVIQDEGLLLLICKEEMEDKNDMHTKGIYAFDLSEETLRDSPYLSLNIDDQIDNLQRHNISKNPLIGMSVKSRLDSFGPSGMDRDPITGNLYIISSRGKFLVVSDTTGEIQGIFFLNQRMFGQPEGLCFDTRGNLYISNEARSTPANIITFTRKQAQ